MLCELLGKRACQASPVSPEGDDADHAQGKGAQVAQGTEEGIADGSGDLSLSALGS